MSKKSTQQSQDNRANQLNPTHSAYHTSRGVEPDQASQEAVASKAVLDNRSSQLNPNNPSHGGGNSTSSKKK